MKQEHSANGYSCACGRSAKTLVEFSGESGSTVTCAVCLYAPPELTASAARNLANAVILDAVRAATTGSVRADSTHEAYCFLRNKSGPFASDRQMWAHLAGVDEESIRVRIRFARGRSAAIEASMAAKTRDGRSAEGTA